MRYFIVSLLLTIAVGYAFAGDRYSSDSYTSVVDKCTALRPNWQTPCAIVGAACPATQNGGSCSEAATGVFISVDGVSTAPINAYIQWDYCSDAFPIRSGNTCVVDDPCRRKAGLAVDDGTVGPGNTKLSMAFPVRPDGIYTGQVFCSGGCKAAVTKDVTSVGIGAGGNYYGQFNANFSGQSCDPPAVNVGPDSSPVKLVAGNSKEYDCLASGRTYGYVNGAVHCLDNASEKKGNATQTKEQKNPDGTTTKTTVEKNVSCTGAGSCVTTTTTTTTIIGADGTQQSTKSEQTKETSETGNPSGSSFCKDNSSSPICKSSSFSGDCLSGFSCDGDSVGCATAKASWMRYCDSKWMKPGNPSASTTALTEKKVLPQSGITPVSISENGQCPADRSFSIAGRTVTFSYSTFCQFLGMIRPVIIAAGWLVAAYIVFGLGQKSE
ncbi:virulence factor TspB C-terminal domain-related protein [Zoogloea sp.]|uniref:virulence factor TspB C-terminal domain-related protein n=1 Tax=Zoogloea sp. TaxID=49181 RepID=UPI001AD11CD0|nr:virulence factor TspB C-terminal domain-related protein [Zoogloea sp.]MBN8281938.1 hypothetical protein [Zoogloea sp.]